MQRFALATQAADGLEGGVGALALAWGGRRVVAQHLAPQIHQQRAASTRQRVCGLRSLGEPIGQGGANLFGRSGHLDALRRQGPEAVVEGGDLVPPAGQRRARCLDLGLTWCDFRGQLFDARLDAVTLLDERRDTLVRRQRRRRAEPMQAGLEVPVRLGLGGGDALQLRDTSPCGLDLPLKGRQPCLDLVDPLVDSPQRLTPRVLGSGHLDRQGVPSRVGILLLVLERVEGLGDGPHAFGRPPVAFALLERGPPHVGEGLIASAHGATQSGVDRLQAKLPRSKLT